MLNVHTTRRCSTLAAFAALSLSSSLIVAPLARAADEGAQAAPPKPVLAFEHAGLSGMFPDERDAGLVRALSMLGTRLKELRNDPNMDPDVRNIPEQAIDVLNTFITDPMRMGVSLGAIDEQTRLPHFGVVLSFDLPNQADADALDQDVEQLRAMSGMQITPEASQRFKGMHDMALPVGMLTYGPRKAADGWRYELLFGEVEDPDAVATYLPKATNVQTTAGRGMLDLAALTPVSEMLGGALAMFAPQAGDVMAQMRAKGIVGADAMKIDMVSGYTATEGVKRITLHGAGKFADALNLSKDPLSSADLSVIPADATAAQMKRMDLQAAWKSMRTQFQQAGQAEQVDAFLAQFKEQTGVDLENDVIAALGDTGAAYLSDSTGGGSLLSGVLAIKLKDPQKIQEALGKLAATANRAAGQLQMGPGSLNLQTKGAMTTVRVRGLPIPIEPSFSVTGDWLVMGASQQACSAAAAQVEHGGAGLASNPRFAKAIPAGANATSVSFVDTERTMSAGYSVLGLLTTALGNFVTSPTLGAQDPGQILPGYAELNKQCRPIVSYNHWSGDDLVMEIRGDRSVLVNAAGLLGVGDAGPMIMGALIGGGAAAAAEKNRAQEYNYNWDEPMTPDENSDEMQEPQQDSDDVEY